MDRYLGCKQPLKVTCDAGEDGSACSAVHVVIDGFEPALDVEFVAGRVGAEQDVLAFAVERVRHVVERVEMRVSEHGRFTQSMKTETTISQQKYLNNSNRNIRLFYRVSSGPSLTDGGVFFFGWLLMFDFCF